MSAVDMKPGPGSLCLFLVYLLESLLSLRIIVFHLKKREREKRKKNMRDSLSCFMFSYLKVVLRIELYSVCKSIENYKAS